MDSTRTFLYIYLGISIITSVFAQLTMKYGMQGFGEPKNLVSIIFMFLNPYILAGIFLYLFSMFFWINVLSKIELSAAYPFASLGIILTVILSSLILSENIPLIRWIGILTVLSGVYLIVSSHKVKD